MNDDVINGEEITSVLIHGTSDGLSGDKLLVTLTDNVVVFTLSTRVLLQSNVRF